MDYPLENLGPERFQQFCQSLLVREHKDVQCFPVGQPDGGRDAISYFTDHSSTKFLMFQVKYARRPHAETDPHKWLLTILEDELPKIARLIPRGASGFYLLTNVPGTAHLDSGSIDRLNEQVSAHIRIPFTCWWRDDICRRLDNAWDLKWAFPDLMTGPDFLRAVLESGFGETRAKREMAIRAFLSEQYKRDEQVRFKQVELQNTLLDLFVDVPVGLRGNGIDHRQHRLFFGITHPLESISNESDDTEVGRVPEFDPRLYSPPSEIGAAALLLHSTIQTQMPRIVLEGAPGQGKSTIAQFISQVHRMKLLGNSEALTLVRKEHRDNAVRLPIKVDLRDLATWLSKKDPFGVDETDAAPPNWKKTLESFLAALISAQSGGASFTTDDLLAVIKISSVLVVFDGLDEVADIGLRKEVVDEIVKGVQRLEANAASLQIVVTSRPAAFANSPGMPVDRYPHLQLVSLSRVLIDEYAERWLRARRIDSKEASEFKKALKEKLDLPHLRDLARNPMQLAILLSLVSTRGTSLPDKRTALYDNYVDLFFNREAEKSTVVRDHRDLLIDIHRYLAWVLHSEAERGNSRGSISQEKLQTLLTSYLSREGYDPKLATELFTGMVERVVALVSRIEGTFEFEVQPLREYFAARFLYDTAPYSPPGGEQRGTKPDRFDALARNFYWTNVTRFYAGCFSKGELPGLVERLQELVGEEGFRLTTHPRMLAATLLADWVFTQNPKSVQSVVDLVLDGFGLRYLVACGSPGRRRHGIWNPLVLPSKCGRDQLIQSCFQVLAKDVAPGYARDAIELLKANASSRELADLWIEHYDPKRVRSWLDHGVNLGALSQVDVQKLEAVMDLDRIPCELLYRARRLDILERSEESFELAVTGVLEGKLYSQRQRRSESALDSLCHALDPLRYGIAFSERAPVSLNQLMSRFHRAEGLLWPSDIVTNTETYHSHKACVEVAKVAERESARAAAEWAVDLTPWNAVVEACREIWGDKWALYSLANIAAGIRSTTIRCKEASDLLDHHQPLCARARHARLKSSDASWWSAQFERASNNQELMFVSLIAISWVMPKTLVTISAPLDRALGQLSSDEWIVLMRAARNARIWGYPKGKTRPLFETRQLAKSLSPRAVVALGLHASTETAHNLYSIYLKDDDEESDPFVLDFIQQQALDIQNFGTKDWSPDLERVEQCYRAGILDAHLPIQGQESMRSIMPLDLAMRIASSSEKFPTALLRLADERCTREIGKKSRPVARTAEEDNWFEPPAMRRLFVD